MRYRLIMVTPQRASQARARRSTSFAVVRFAAVNRGANGRRGNGQGQRMHRPWRYAPGQSPARLTGSARKPCVRASENTTRAFRRVRSSWGGEGNTVTYPAPTGIQVRTGQQ